MAKPTAQQCHALTTFYVNKYNEVVGSNPRVNRNKARWSFESILMDYTPSQVMTLIEFYLEHYDTPSLEWFFYNYDKVEESMVERQKQEDSAAKRRAETAKRLQEWRNRWQK